MNVAREMFEYERELRAKVAAMTPEEFTAACEHYFAVELPEQMKAVDRAFAAATDALRTELRTALS